MIRRRVLYYSAVIGVLVGIYFVVSGIALKIILRKVERTMEQKTPYRLSIAYARLTLNGHIEFDDVTLRTATAPLAKFREIRIYPAWREIRQGRLSAEGVTIVSPTVTVSSNAFSVDSASSGSQMVRSVLALIGNVDIIDGRLLVSSGPKSVQSFYPLNLHGSFDGKRIRINSFDVRSKEAHISAHGTYTVDSHSVDLKIRTQDFPLERIAQTFVSVPSGVHAVHTGDWLIKGNLQSWKIKSTGRLVHDFGKVKLTTNVSGRARFDGKKVEIETFVRGSVMSAMAHLIFDAKNKNVDGQFSLASAQISELSTVWPMLEKASGSGSVTGTVHGPMSSPDLTIHGHGDALRYEELGIEKLQVHFERQGYSKNPMSLEVTPSSLTWSSRSGTPQIIPSAHLAWQGDLNQGSLRLHFQTASGIVVKGEGHADRKDGGLAWRLETLHVKLLDGQEWTAVPGGEMEIKKSGGVEVQNLEFHEKSGRLNILHASFGNEQIDVDASAHHLFLESSPARPEKSLAWSATLDGNVHLEGRLDDPQGHFEIKISSALVGSLPRLDFQSTGTVGHSLMTFQKSRLEFAALPEILIGGSIPWSWIIPEASEEPLNISVEAGPLDPAILLQDVASVKIKSGGFVRLDGSVTGPKHKLKMQGAFSASVPAIEIPSTGFDAKNVQFEIELKNEHLIFRKAEAQVGKGVLRIAGESSLPDLNVDIRGDHLSMKVRREYDLVTNFVLQLRGTLEAPLLTGKIQIDEGTYEVGKKKKEKEKKEIAAPLLRAWDRLQLDVNAHWDNNVWFRDGLTKIETQADLNVLKSHGQRELGLQGRVTLLRGSYDAYGRDFILKSGELDFVDSSEVNPLLNIQATHTMPGAVVDLDVAGTAKKPELHFRSTPPMPEQDILAMLALGRVPGKYSSPTETSDKSVASSGMDLAADMVSSYLTREARSTGMNVLDLDVIRVAPTEKGKEWTVGRYWGSKLFLSYSYNPENSASQVLKAEYTVSPRWMLVGQSGSQTDNYLDLNFRLPVGKRRD